MTAGSLVPPFSFARLGAAVGCSLLLTAALPSPAPAAWVRYGIRDGIGAPGVTAMLEDRSHRIWIGWDERVAVFDGVHAAEYELSALAGRQVGIVQGIAEGDSATMWFATRGGVLAWVPGDSMARVFTSASTNGGLPADIALDAVSSRSGEVWIATVGGIGHRNPTTGTWRGFTTANTGGGLPGDSVSTLVFDPEGRLWAGTNRGAAFFDSVMGWSAITTLTTGGGLPDDRILALSPDREGSVWFATGSGVVAWSRTGNGAWKRYPSSGGETGPMSDAVNGIAADSTNGVWFGTSRGLCRYDPRTDAWPVYDATRTGSVLELNASVSRLTVGNSRRVWVGNPFDAGVAGFDGEEWRRHHPGDAGLPGGFANGAASAPDGRCWFATNVGASQYDDRRWITLSRATTHNSLPSDIVHSVAVDADRDRVVFGTLAGVATLTLPDSVWAQFDDTNTSGAIGSPLVNVVVVDSSGALWAGTPQDGLARQDPVSRVWTPYRGGPGMPGPLDANVESGFCASDGSVWFGTRSGVSMYDSNSGWRSHPSGGPAGPAGNSVFVGCEQAPDTLWFGTSLGASRYVRSSGRWDNFDASNTQGGLAASSVRSIVRDAGRRLWFGMRAGGASYFDGERWVPYATPDLLGDETVRALVADPDGRLWFGTDSNVIELEPDRVAPLTVFGAPLAPVIGAASVTLTFSAGFAEHPGVEFSHRLDGGLWSAWSTATFWNASALHDGPHRFEVRARDIFGNVEPAAAVESTLVDATPPVPLLSSPAPGEVVRGAITLEGEADDERFASYVISGLPAGASVWQRLDSLTMPIPAGVLALVDTRALPDGPTLLELAVVDDLGLRGVAHVAVVIDNHFPPAERTAPAIVHATTEDDVYSPDGALHLSFPANAFAHDTEVTVTEVSLDALIGEARAYAIAWGSEVLRKPCLVGAHVDPGTVVPGTRLRLVRVDGGPTTVSEATAADPDSISGWITEPGVYELLASDGVVAPTPGAFSLFATPRVAVMRHGFGGVVVGFHLAAPDRVTVTVYNRAGRHVARLLELADRPAGRSTVTWDGRGEGGEAVPPGLYVLSIRTTRERAETAIAIER